MELVYPKHSVEVGVDGCSGQAVDESFGGMLRVGFSRQIIHEPLLFTSAIHVTGLTLQVAAVQPCTLYLHEWSALHSCIITED